MKVLIIGGGGREHAIAWKLAQSPKVSKLWCAPGNGGISEICECVPIKATDVIGIVNFCKQNNPHLVVVTPDDPLMLGMVDALTAAGFRAFGPTKDAALIEGSKAFAKDLMKRYSIPTANYEVFDDAEEAINYVKKEGAPIVVKADGLALGKGVRVAKTEQEAIEFIRFIMDDKIFGASGARVIIEEVLEGPEVSVLCFTDGNTIVPMPSAQDHKRAFDGDEGPNTGGMGAFSPSAYYTSEIAGICRKRIFIPTIDAMKREGRSFKGVLYFGLMLTQDGPKVIEYNARFGDPETQAILTKLDSDLFDIMNAVIDDKLDKTPVKWSDDATCCIILASGGYPGKYETGYEIFGIDDAICDDVTVFHAGTKRDGARYVTSGGRVLGVTAKGRNLAAAIEKAYEKASLIKFEGVHMRRDIGKK